jgi:two-component system response regulator DesR
MAETGVVRVIVVDPSAVFYEGMRHCLSQGGHDAMGQAHNLDEALRLLDGLHPDLVIIGPDLEEHESLAICREILCRFSSIKTIIVSAHTSSPLFLADAAYSGACACVRRRVSHEECLVAVAAVMSGQRLFSHEILSDAFRRINLTEREREILRLIAERKTSREIANALKISVNTVRNHSQSILEKLSVDSRAEAMRRAQRRGWI